MVPDGDRGQGDIRPLLRIHTGLQVSLAQAGGPSDLSKVPVGAEYGMEVALLVMACRAARNGSPLRFCGRLRSSRWARQIGPTGYAGG